MSSVTPGEGKISPPFKHLPSADQFPEVSCPDEFDRIYSARVMMARDVLLRSPVKSRNVGVEGGLQSLRYPGTASAQMLGTRDG